jgi:hypothetical protein
MGEPAKSLDPMRRAIAEVVHDVLREHDPYEGGRKISQKTVLSARGIAPRVFLEHARDPDLKPSVLRVGKLRIVALDVYDAFLAKLSEQARAPKTGNDDADDLLASLGMIRGGSK